MFIAQICFAVIYFYIGCIRATPMGERIEKLKNKGKHYGRKQYQ